MSDSPYEIDGIAVPQAPEVLKELDRVGESDSAEAIFEEEFAEKSVKIERSYVHLNGLIEHYRHKGIWSEAILSLIGFMVLFQSLLLCMVGSGYWSFEKYTWLLPVLLVQNLAQIVGLAVLVVRSLFRNMGSD